MNQKQIGEFIRLMRKEQGWTQEELASKLNVTNRTISRWENGNYMPDISQLEPLANILNVTVLELIRGRRIEKLDTVEVDSFVLECVQEEKRLKKGNVFWKLVAVLSIVALMVTFLFLPQYLDSYLYVFEAESENFKISSGLALYSDEARCFRIRELELLAEPSEFQVEKFRISVYFDDKLYGVSEYHKKEGSNFLEYLENEQFGSYSLEKISKDAGDSFTFSNGRYFPRNMEIIVAYKKSGDDSVYRETLKVNITKKRVSNGFSFDIDQSDDVNIYDKNSNLIFSTKTEK